MVKLLTNLDRDSFSPSYGSFDRNYWHYKIRDFSSAILQQGCLALAIAYSKNFDGNIYYNNEQIKKHAVGAVKFWSTKQLKDGSFEEYWSNERSIPATAFSLYAICETIDILDIKDAEVLKTIKKAVAFLKNITEPGALNQEMASVAAIRYAAKILDDDIKEIANKKFKSLLAKQSKEGWYAEYNGVDIGYLTVCLDYLVKYYELSKSSEALESAKKIIHFIKYFVHPDGTLGGEYCTRNTEYFLPYGLEFMKKYEPITSKILEKLMSNINKSYLNSCLDERYVLHYVCPSFIKSISIFKEVESKQDLPYNTIFNKYFEDSMIYIKSSEKYYFICSLMKSGVFKIIDKKNMDIYNDTCYRIIKNGKIYTSEWPNRNKYSIEDNKIVIESDFIKKSFFIQTPFKQTILKTVSSIFGRLPVDIVKKVMIYGKNKKSGMKFKREIILDNDRMSINDFIDTKNRVQAHKMNGLSMRHTASSRLFQVNSLKNKIKSESFEINDKKEIKLDLHF